MTQPVQSRIAPGVTGAVSEFWSGFTAACGQAAAEILYAASAGTSATAGDVAARVRQMQAAGLAGAQGTSTLGGNAWALAQEGVQTMQTSDWLGAITQNAGQRPVMIGVTNGGALPGDEPGLQGHFLSIVGYTNRGTYLAADPDNTAAQSGNLVEYTPAQIAAAQPFGALVATGSAPTPPENPFGQGVVSGINAVFPGSATLFNGSAQQATQQATGGGNAVLNWLGVNPSTLFWRAGLVIGGGLLVLMGLVLFFSHSQAGQTIIENGKAAAGTAAKAAAVAA